MSGTSDDGEYDLGPSFPIAEARRQRPGTTLLVTGPGAVIERAALEILLGGPGEDESVVPLSTDWTDADLRTEFTDRTGTDPGDRLAVIDITGESGDVTSPDDLAAIGRALNETIEGLDTSRVRVGVLSLTGMLDHLDRTDVFKFCHVVRDRIDSAGYLGVATLDTEKTPEATVSMLQQAFDVTAEVQADEKGDLVRVLGLPDTPVTWHAWG
jgi:hypothetical protein